MKLQRWLHYTSAVLCCLYTTQSFGQNSSACAADSQHIVAGYMTNWSKYSRQYFVNDIPADKLTHIYHAFVGICGENASYQVENSSGASMLKNRCSARKLPKFSIESTDASSEGLKTNGDELSAGMFADYRKLKQDYPHIKIIPSIGGYSLSDPFFLMDNPNDRKVFVDSVIHYLKKYDFFDGVDIDWEFPGGGGHPKAMELANINDDPVVFSLLMKELREALDQLENDKNREYELHTAVGISAVDTRLDSQGNFTGSAYIGSIDWSVAANYIDHINIMSYDYVGGWNNVSGHHTALYPSSKTLPGNSASEAVNLLLSLGVPSYKVSIGAAMYGRGWNHYAARFEPPTGGKAYPWPSQNYNQYAFANGIIDYRGIEKFYLENSFLQGFIDPVTGVGERCVPQHCEGVRWDNIAKAHTWYQGGVAHSTSMSFESARSAEEKGKFAKNNQLGGVFAWSLDGDSSSHTLLNAINKGVGNQCSE